MTARAPVPAPPAAHAPVPAPVPARARLPRVAVALAMGLTAATLQAGPSHAGGTPTETPPAGTAAPAGWARQTAPAVPRSGTAQPVGAPLPPAAGTPGRYAGTGWAWPVDPPVVARAYAPPAQPWMSGHRGRDLAVAPGALVRAAGTGTVTYASPLAGRGVVVVTHGELRTTYEPVLPLVAVGQHVHAGEPIGVVQPGAGHCGAGRCLHLGLRRGREYLDPMLVLGRTRAILVPW